MKYYLHYVASGKSGIYGKDVFINEAKKIGVNRSLPYFLIKKLKWGDKILLATFESCNAGKHAYKIVNHNEIDDETFKSLYWNNKDGWIDEESADIFYSEGLPKFNLPIGGEWVCFDRTNAKFKGGVASVFGYFVISGLNITASNELKRRLFSQLDITKSYEGCGKVQRSCGSYVITASHIVNNSLADIIEKAQTLAKEMNEKVKYFIAGNFYEVQTIIEDVNFSRSLVEVDFGEVGEITDFGNYVGFIQDYNKKTYIPKKERV